MYFETCTIYVFQASTFLKKVTPPPSYQNKYQITCLRMEDFQSNECKKAIEKKPIRN